MAGWTVLDSSIVHSECGENAPQTPEAMMDATNPWFHIVNEVHWLILDLGADVDIRKWRFKRLSTNNPDDMDMYFTTSLGTGGNAGTWGTAVATGIDINSMGSTFTEVITTPKTARYVYFHINSTAHGSDLLAWGANTGKVIEYWEGAIPDRFTTHINITDKLFTTTSTTFTPTDGSLGMFEWDGGKYTNIISAFFEVCSIQTGSGVPNSAPTVVVELFDRTGAAQITQTTNTGTTPDLARSVEMSANLPSGVATLDVRLKRANSATNATVYSARLIIVQETDGATKTRIYIPVGANVGGGATNYTATSSLGLAVGSSEEKHYIWNDADFATVDAIKFQANIFSTTAATTSFAKIGTSSSGTLGEVSTSNTVPTLLESSDISGSISDGGEYTAWLKNSTARRNVNLVGAWIVIDLTSVTKYQSLLSVNSWSQQETTTGWIEALPHQAQFDANGAFFDGVTVVATHAATVWHIGDTNMQAAIYDDGVRNATSDVINTTTTRLVKESAALTIADGSILTGSGNLNSSGAFIFGNIGGSGIYCTVTDVSGAVEAARNRYHAM